MRRGERIACITKTLVDQPGKLFSLNQFAELFPAAKSTISEDLTIIREALDRLGAGRIETLAGAAGGVRFLPHLDEEGIQAVIDDLCTALANPDRILPGGFLYMTDLIFDPIVSARVGEVFATRFAGTPPDAVVTVETKGIPLALMTARAFHVPLVTIRRDSRVTEGSFVSINYVSGSTRRIQSMSLSRRALAPGSSVLVIDDFMKAGGTAQGICDLMQEFNSRVLGIGVLVETAEPAEKLVDNYFSLAVLEQVDEAARTVRIRPGRHPGKG